MGMKHFIFLIIAGLLTSVMYGQSRQEDTSKTYVPIIPSEKQNRLKNVDILVNMNYNLRNDFYNGEHTNTSFKFEQFRLEIKGYVSEKIYFRFRHRYTSTFEPQTIDKIIKNCWKKYGNFHRRKTHAYPN